MQFVECDRFQILLCKDLKFVGAISYLVLRPISKDATCNNQVLITTLMFVQYLTVICVFVYSFFNETVS